MRFEVDVSGPDIFTTGYVICIAEKDGKIIRGFKFDKELVDRLVSNWKADKYRYTTSDRQKGFFKVRVYCIVLYYLFKSIAPIIKKDKLNLTICRDFHGHENDIDMNLKFFLERKIDATMGKPAYEKLPLDSYAHAYAKLMFNDVINLFSTYSKITLDEIELFLKKNVTPKGRTTES